MSPRFHARAHRASGFSLVELLFVIAIAVVLGIILYEAIAAGSKSSECKKALDQAKAAVKSCSDLSTSWNKDSALSCLAKAQSALDAYLKNCDPSDRVRQALSIAVIELNAKVDELKSNVESDEDKQKLEKAKLHVPAKGEGTPNK
jgi:prepilin-type N-terminal cleavage/methylation domain-containing protein